MKHFLNFFSPEIFFAFAGLGFSSSKSSQATSSSTSTEITDNRVAASEGSISAGSGATVNVESSDPAAIAAAGDAIARVAMSANDAMSESAQASIFGNVDVAREALRTGSDQLATVTDLGRDALRYNYGTTADALDFGERALQIATNAANRSQDSTNDLVQRTNEQFTATLARNAGDAPQTVVQDALKYGLIAIAVLGGMVVFLRPQSKAA
jgi:hypothetical protein